VGNNSVAIEKGREPYNKEGNYHQYVESIEHACPVGIAVPAATELYCPLRGPRPQYWIEPTKQFEKRLATATGSNASAFLCHLCSGCSWWRTGITWVVQFFGAKALQFRNLKASALSADQPFAFTPGIIVSLSEMSWTELSRDNVSSAVK
jgi:hypothetical protein